MSKLLLLTVGTGTAGPASNLTLGLIHTIQQIEPRAYWLIPSSSPDALAIAQLVREAIPDSFMPWSEESPYPIIDDHDQIDRSRAVVREVIRRVRKQLRTGERLLVNPTSGTKQMSGGATLAALDEQVGDIIFTVGQRQDGVVIAGQERLTAFDPALYFAERDLTLARDLFRAGSWKAAARVLEPHPAHQKQHALCLCRWEWSRLAYAEAARHAARFSEPIRAHLSALARSAENGGLAEVLIWDLLENADDFFGRGDTDTAAILAYKALEHGVRLRLLQTAGIAPPYLAESFAQFALSHGLQDRLAAVSSDGKVRPGLRLLFELLQALGDPMAVGYLRDRELQKGLTERNQTAHEISPADPKKVGPLLARVRALCADHFEHRSGPARPSDF